MDVKLRKAREADLRKIFEWRNDPLVRQNSFSSREISMEEHMKYWSSRLEDWKRHSYVVLAGGNDAGLVRLDPIVGAGGEYEVHIMVAPAMQGKGVGLAAIAAAKKEAKRLGIKKLFARVKPENSASQAIFKKNGFSGGPEKYECAL